LAVSTLKPRDFELMSSALHQDPITLTAAPCFDLADDGRRIRSYAPSAARSSMLKLPIALWCAGTLNHCWTPAAC
jgi:hypothetical protein